MKLMPRLYSTEKDSDPFVQAMFFLPDAQWTWYAIEFDGQDAFFGYVVGLENELGYFSLSELESVRGPFGLRVERDLYFEPVPLGKIMAKAGRAVI